MYSIPFSITETIKQSRCQILGDSSFQMAKVSLSMALKN